MTQRIIIVWLEDKNLPNFFSSYRELASWNCEMVLRPDVVCSAGVNESGNKLVLFSLCGIRRQKIVYKIE